ncbi:MAG: Coenzyme F420 hydrogenase/dehydrogenase, beta subunit C-terminal domain [Bacteroidales bacterium]
MGYTIEDIVRGDLCTGCGLCTSESRTSTMEWNSYGFLTPKLDGSFNEKAIEVCPFNPTPHPKAKDEDHLAKLIFGKSTSNSNKEIGQYIDLFVGHSVAYRKSSSSGGLATYILDKLLEEGQVQHIFGVMEEGGSYSYNWYSPATDAAPSPVITAINTNAAPSPDTQEDITKISKTRYYPVTMEKLFKEIETKEGKIAVVGVPCFIKAVRLKLFHNPQYHNKIAFTVGIFCGGIKSSFYSHYLAQKAGIKGEYCGQEYRIKNPTSNALDYSFGAYTRPEEIEEFGKLGKSAELGKVGGITVNEEVREVGEFKEVRMQTLGDMWGTGLFKNNGCDFCDDISAELADISLGDAWFPPHIWDGKGTSVAITRTPLAQKLIESGIESGELIMERLPWQTLKESLISTINHRQRATLFRLNYTIRKAKKGVEPYKRERLLEPIALPYQLVQIARVKLRRKSLKVWQKCGNAKEFEKRVWSLKKRLALYTKVYHRLERRR